MATYLYTNRPAKLEIGMSQNDALYNLNRLNALDLVRGPYSETYSVSVPIPEGFPIDAAKLDTYWFLPYQFIWLQTDFENGKLSNILVWHETESESGGMEIESVDALQGSVTSRNWKSKN